MAKKKSSRKTGKSPVADIAALSNGAWEENADKPQEITGGSMPDNISGGVALFSGYKVGYVAEGKTNAGQPYVSMNGIIVQPKEHEGRRVFKTTVVAQGQGYNGQPGKTPAQRVTDIQNDMKNIGINTKGTGPNDIEDLLAAHLKKEKHFRFDTYSFGPTKERPNPPVNLKFLGECVYNEDDEDDGVQDATDQGDEIEDPEQEYEEDTYEAADDEEEETADEEPDEEGEVSLQDHADFADDNDDEDSQMAITEEANKYNIDTNEYETWKEVVEAIVKAQNAPKKKTPRKKKKKAAAR